MGFKSVCNWLIFGRVFNIVFKGFFFSVISLRQVHLPMLSWSTFNQYSAQYFFPATGCSPTQPSSKPWTAVRGRNEYCRNNCHQSSERILARQAGGSNKLPPVLKTCTLPNELRGEWGGGKAGEASACLQLTLSFPNDKF